MRPQEDRLAQARREANRLLRRFGVEYAHDVNVEGFAHRLGVQLVDAPLMGADGQLVVVGDFAAILIPPRLERGARRWVIAHELGHFVMMHRTPSPETLIGPRPRFGSCDLPADEVEADCFALSLLTPEAAVSEFRSMRPMTLQPPRLLARMCGVSLEAAAIRLAELTDLTCAVVLSDHDVISWVACAPRFLDTFGTNLVPGQCVRPSSVASRYFRGELMLQAPEIVPARAWLNLPAQSPVVEHSLPGTSPGTVITMIWASSHDRRVARPRAQALLRSVTTVGGAPAALGGV